MIWRKHNKECQRTDSHMVCGYKIDDQSFEYATYNIITLNSKKESFVKTGNVYPNPTDAKEACHRSAGKVSTKGMSNKKKARVNFDHIKGHVLG